MPAQLIHICYAGLLRVDANDLMVNTADADYLWMKQIRAYGAGDIQWVVELDAAVREAGGPSVCNVARVVAT